MKKYSLLDKKKLPKIIFLTGVDGAGKTLYTNMLLEELKKQGITAQHVWSRYNNFLSKPLLALTYLSGHNYRESHEGIRFGYHDFGKSEMISSLFTMLQMIDLNIATYLKIYHHIRNGKLLVCDRSPYDTLVDVMLDTGRNYLSDKYIKVFLSTLPKEHLVFYIYRPLEKIYEDRPELRYDRSLVEKIRLYEKSYKFFGWMKLDNINMPNRLFAKMMVCLNEI